MVIGLHDSWARENRGRTWRFLKRTFLLWVVVTIAVGSYWAGAVVGHREMEETLNRLVAVSKTVDELKAAAEEQKAAAQRAVESETQWRRRYEQEVPSGPAKQLQEIIQGRLQAGVSADRLAAVIGAIAEKRSCDKPERPKRLVVNVPAEAGQPPGVEPPEPPMSFADGAIVLTADGAPKITAKGTVLRGFDPGKPVTVRFNVAGGGGSSANGVLPIRHSITVGENDFRFLIATDRWGHAVVTAERCKYP